MGTGKFQINAPPPPKKRVIFSVVILIIRILFKGIRIKSKYHGTNSVFSDF